MILPAPISTFEIRLLDDGGRETNLDRAREAVVIIDAEDRLASIGAWPNGWTGLWPNRITGAESPLLPSSAGDDAFVAVCSCGELGCAGLRARITLVDHLVVWEQFRIGADSRSADNDRVVESDPLVFEAVAYTEAVLRPGQRLTAWEPTSRQVAAVIAERLAAERSTEDPVRFAGASHLGDGAVELAVMIRGSGERTHLRRRFELGTNASVEQAAAQVIDYFTSRAFLSDPETIKNSY